MNDPRLSVENKNAQAVSPDDGLSVIQALASGYTRSHVVDEIKIYHRMIQYHKYSQFVLLFLHRGIRLILAFVNLKLKFNSIRF